MTDLPDWLRTGAHLAQQSQFADQRSWLGITNAADVLSNLAFSVPAMVAARCAANMGVESIGDSLARRLCSILTLATGLLVIGSSVFHLAPGAVTLIGDRLPKSKHLLAAAGSTAVIRWIDQIRMAQPNPIGAVSAPLIARCGSA